MPHGPEYTPLTLIRYQKQPGDWKLLPCMTLCPVSGYKTKGVYASPKSFLENTCNLNDIFEAESKRKIKNESLYFCREVKTIFQGRCFTVCDLVERAPKQEVIINLSFKQDLKLFVHRRGEEFWLSASYVFPLKLVQQFWTLPMEKAWVEQCWWSLRATRLCSTKKIILA